MVTAYVKSYDPVPFHMKSLSLCDSFHFSLLSPHLIWFFLTCFLLLSNVTDLFTSTPSFTEPGGFSDSVPAESKEKSSTQRLSVSPAKQDCRTQQPFLSGSEEIPSRSNFYQPPTSQMLLLGNKQNPEQVKCWQMSLAPLCVRGSYLCLGLNRCNYFKKTVPLLYYCYCSR